MQMANARSLSAEMPEGNGTGFVWDDEVNIATPSTSMDTDRTAVRSVNFNIQSPYLQ